MAKQKFGLNLAQKMNNGTTAGAELRKIETQEIFNYQVIPYDKIKPNEINDYPINEINKLKDSIKRYGLIDPLGIIPIQEDGEIKYKLLAGERRYTAIGRLLEEGDTTFKAGVPARVFEDNMNDIDQEIVLRESNELARDHDPERKRKNIQRLSELYEIRNEMQGIKSNVTKDIAEATGLNVRQVQRYNAVNKGLSERLKKALDNGKLTLENAANISNWDEETQEEIADLLEKQSKISKEEYLYFKAESERKAKEYEERYKEAEENKKIVEQQLSKSKEEIELLEQLLKEKEEEENRKNEENRLKEEEIRRKIEEEIATNNPDKLKLEELEKTFKEKEKHSQTVKKEKEEIEKSLKEKLREIEELKNKLNKTLSENKEVKNELTQEEKEKLRAEFEINNIMSDIKKGINQFVVKNMNYKESFETVYKESETFYKEMIEKLEQWKEEVK